MGWKLRLFGIVPLTIFIFHWVHHAANGNAPHILWLCNLNNIMMALGLLLNAPLLFRIAVLWLVPALPLWFLDSYLANDFALTSILSHVGAVTIGISLLPVIRMDRRSWIPAYGYGLAIQIICRLWTPPEMNVNVAHYAYGTMHWIFPRYWMFWMFVSLAAALALWVMNVLLHRIFPFDSTLSRT